LAWLNRCRRLAKDFESLSRNARAFLQLASIRLMLRKLCNPVWTFRTDSEKSPNQTLYLITAPDISVIFGARGKLGYTLRATVRTHDFARCHLDASAKGQCPTASGIKPDERVAGTIVDRPPQTHARDIHRLLHSSHSSDGAVPS
jgi:hypothetical protein